MRGAAALALLAALAACGTAGPAPGASASPEATGTLVPAASGETPPWDEPVTGAIGVTRWYPVGSGQRPIDPGGGPWADPTALMEDTWRYFAGQAVGGEVEAEVVEQDPETGTAVGHVRVLTAGDDSVAGIDMRLQLARSDDGWQIISVEERIHCRRGVSGDRCV